MLLKAWLHACPNAQPRVPCNPVPANQVGHFWQYLVNSFPETLDFLASVSERERDEFVNVIEVNAQNPGLLMNMHDVRVRLIVRGGHSPFAQVCSIVAHNVPPFTTTFIDLHTIFRTYVQLKI